MLGGSCSPCCGGCSCDIKPSSIKLSTPTVAYLVDERIKYVTGSEFGTPAPNGSRLGYPADLEAAIILNFVKGIGSAGFGSVDVVLSRDDSIADYGGFAYAYDGVPGVASGSSRAFTFNNYFGGPSVSVPNLTMTCVSLTAQVFFFSAADGPAVIGESTEPAPPCMRAGFYVSDTHRVSAPHDNVLFTRTAMCDGLSAATTWIDSSAGSGVNRYVIRRPPSVCIDRIALLPLLGSNSNIYVENNYITSSPTLTGNVPAYYSIILDSQ